MVSPKHYSSSTPIWGCTMGSTGGPCNNRLRLPRHQDVLPYRAWQDPTHPRRDLTPISGLANISSTFCLLV